MANKVLISLVLAVALVAAVHGANNLNIGTYHPGAVLVRNELVTVKPVRNQIQQRTVSYSGLRNVTLIQAFDQFSNGTGGWPRLSGGGLNLRVANVTLTSSKAGRGFSFRVKIFAV